MYNTNGLFTDPIADDCAIFDAKPDYLEIFPSQTFCVLKTDFFLYLELNIVVYFEIQ